MAEKLGRIQGGGFFGSSSTSTTSIALTTVTTNEISPLVGDTIVNANGDLCRITAITSSAYTVTKYGSIKGATGATAYDTIISTQAEFESWYTQLESGSYTGHSVLIMEGSYKKKGSKPIEIPEGTFVLEGVGKVHIELESYDYSTKTPGVIRYSGTAANADHRIINIEASASGTASTIFYGLHNLINCKVSYGYTGFDSCENLLNCGVSSYNTYGFRNCSYLTNCSCIAYSSGNPSGTGFYMCSNLADCVVKGGLQPIAFEVCFNLSGCVGEANNYQGTGYAFRECKGLTNCSGKASGMGTSYVFYSCQVCSGCYVTEQLDPYNSNKKAWGGDNYNVDPVTCPEYDDVTPSGGTPINVAHDTAHLILDTDSFSIDAPTRKSQKYIYFFQIRGDYRGALEGSGERNLQIGGGPDCVIIHLRYQVLMDSSMAVGAFPIVTIENTGTNYTVSYEGSTEELSPSYVNSGTWIDCTIDGGTSSEVAYVSYTRLEIG